MVSGCGKFVLVAWIAATFMISEVLCQTGSTGSMQSISPSPSIIPTSIDNTEIYQWVVGIVSVLIAFTIIVIIGLLFRLFFHYVQEKRLKRFGYLRSKPRRGKRRRRSHLQYVVAKRPPPVPTLSQRVLVDDYGQSVGDDYGYIPPPPNHPPPSPPMNDRSGFVYHSGREFVPIADSNPEPSTGGGLLTIPQQYQERHILQQTTNREHEAHVTRPSRLQRGAFHPPTIPEEGPQPTITDQDALPQQHGEEHPPTTSKQDEDLARDHTRRSITSATSGDDYGGWRRSPPDEFIFGRRDSSRRSGSRSHRHHSGNRRDQDDLDPLYQSLSTSVVNQAVVRNPIHAHGRRF